MSLVFYLSGHGFGHASRQVEVINVLGALRPDMPIEIRSMVNPDLLARTLAVPYALVPTLTDPGIVQRDSVTHDDEATLARAIDFYRGYEGLVAGEARSLPAATLAVVGDIPPLAFDVAAARGLPSVAIANFTWDWIYETHRGFDSQPWIVPLIRHAYQRATVALELPFSGGFEIFPRRRRIPLIARRGTRSRADTFRFLGVPEGRPTVLLSFGGYGLPALEFERLDCLDRWTVITTDRVSAGAADLPNVVTVSEAAFLGADVRYEDLVAAVDVVLTKPGYGIIAECIAGHTALVYTSRGEFREYDVLVEAMPRYLRSRFLSQADLFAGRWRHALAAVLTQPAPPEHLPTDGAEAAAAAILDLLEA